MDLQQKQPVRGEPPAALGRRALFAAALRKRCARTFGCAPIRGVSRAIAGTAGHPCRGEALSTFSPLLCKFFAFVAVPFDVSPGGERARIELQGRPLKLAERNPRSACSPVKQAVPQAQKICKSDLISCSGTLPDFEVTSRRAAGSARLASRRVAGSARFAGSASLVSCRGSARLASRARRGERLIQSLTPAGTGRCGSDACRRPSRSREPDRPADRLLRTTPSGLREVPRRRC